MQIIKCPHCGKSHYAENYHTSTAMGWTPVVKDGVRYDEDPNIHTTHCTCLECGGEFAFDNKGNISKGRTAEEIQVVTSEVLYNSDNTCEATKWDYNLSSSIFESPKLYIDFNSFKNICIRYNEKEYEFDTDKIIKILCKELKGE